MDIYKKILVIVIVLVYLNALALFMIDRMTTDSIIGYDGKVIPDPSRVIDLSGAVKSQDVAGDALKRTAFAASDVIDPEVLGLNPSEVDFSVLNQIRFGGNVTVDENALQEDYLIPKEVVTCKSQPPVYLASLFGRIHIMQGSTILSTYTVTFEKNHRDKDTLGELSVERKVFLPTEPGQYVLRLELFDRLSSKKIIREQVFSVS